MDIFKVLMWGVVYWLVANILGKLIYLSPWQGQIGKIFLVLAPILTIIFSLLYFRESKAKIKILEGLGVGIIWMIISVILDAIFVVWFFVKDFVGYFGRSLVWAGYLQMIVLVILVGLVFQILASRSQK